MIDAGTYDELDRYALEKMPAEERSAFEKRIASEEGLREELEWLAAATLAMNSSGKSIMQKQIAQIVAAVPASALEKYTPSINKKGVLKKWGWAIAGIVALAAGIAVWWFVIRSAPSTDGGENRGESKDMIAPADTVKTNEQLQVFPPTDSCMDTLMRKEPGSLFREDSVPLYPSGKGSKSKPPATDRNTERNAVADTGKGLIISAATSGYYAWPGNEQIPWFDISYRSPKGNSPTYLFGEKLVLYSNYKSSSGLCFYENTNSITMVDSIGNTFVLTKSPKEQALVMQQPGGKIREENVRRK